MGEQWRDGDVFRWSWRCAEKLGRSPDPYWCLSRIAVVRGDRLVDTYWHGNDNWAWTREQAAERLDLKFVANLGDLVLSPYAVGHYHPDDVVDLSHPNRPSEVYVRKGAKECLRTQIEVAERKLAASRCKVDMEQRWLDMLKERLAAEVKEVSNE